MLRSLAVFGATAIAFAAPAYADEQGFLNEIHSAGVPAGYFGTAGADYSNIKAAEMICDVLHRGTRADVPFLGFQQNGYRDVIIDAAQHNLCPDTLHR